eukprot:1694497-Rhodomonas_salina.1
MCGTEQAYGATRCAVLRQRMTGKRVCTYGSSARYSPRICPYTGTDLAYRTTPSLREVRYGDRPIRRRHMAVPTQSGTERAYGGTNTVRY